MVLFSVFSVMCDMEIVIVLVVIIDYGWLIVFSVVFVLVRYFSGMLICFYWFCGSVVSVGLMVMCVE